MKKNLCLTASIMLLIFFSCVQTEEQKLNKHENAMNKKLRHVVLFKFKESTSKDSIKIVEKAFLELPNKIKEIKSFEWGINNSPEGLNKGFTHSFILTFDDEKGREIYLPHPSHKVFGEIVKPVLEDVLVVDYWIKQ